MIKVNLPLFTASVFILYKSILVGELPLSSSLCRYDDDAIFVDNTLSTRFSKAASRTYVNLYLNDNTHVSSCICEHINDDLVCEPFGRYF